MTMNQRVLEPSSELPSRLERDLSIIRRDLLAVLQETADVRATMTRFSSFERGVSKRFVVVSGLICFMLLIAMIMGQAQLRSWLGLM